MWHGGPGAPEIPAVTFSLQNSRHHIFSKLKDLFSWDIRTLFAWILDLPYDISWEGLLARFCFALIRYAKHVCPSFFHYHQYRTITTRLDGINELIIKITSSSKLSRYELVPTLVTLKFEIGQPLGCQGGNFLVATAKSEDGFRKAQQLTEEATETPRRHNCGLRKRPRREFQRKGKGSPRNQSTFLSP